MNTSLLAWPYDSSLLYSWAPDYAESLILKPSKREGHCRIYVRHRLCIQTPWSVQPLYFPLELGPLERPVSPADDAVMLNALIEIAIHEAEEAWLSFVHESRFTFSHGDAKKNFVTQLSKLDEPVTQEAVFELWQRNEEHYKTEVVALNLSRELHLEDYPSMYPVARTIDRRFTVILGPTNSGKTYRAVEILKAADTGVYLGPLRLLALEIQERLQEEHVPCSLITGEEIVLVPGAGHRSSTVEMLDVDIPVDVAVVDEVQMLADVDRGWAWTAAIVGVPAKHVVLVGSPDIWPVLKVLLQRLGVTPEVIRTERLQALDIERTPVDPENAEAGDAFVVFSRKDVFWYQEILAKKGLAAAVIYGALGPEVRRSEARRFKDGQAKVLIATDAIGMGLNLPISRVLLTTDSKFNGVEVGYIEPSLVKQIAGRAGRYGFHAKGMVAGVNDEAHAYLKECLNISTKIPFQRVSVAPTTDQLLTIAARLQLQKASDALVAWRSYFFLKDEHFEAAVLADRLDLALRIEDAFPSMLMSDVAMLSMVPLPRHESVEDMFFEWLHSYMQGTGTVDWVCYLPNANSDRELQDLEVLYHTASVYIWLSHKKPKRFASLEGATQDRARISELLINLLRTRARRVVQQGSKAKKK